MLRALWLRWWLASVGLVLVAPVAHAGQAPFSATVAKVCRDTIARVEREQGIPKLLLSAIALAETGRWHAERGESIAWPWTVTSGKDSSYHPNKEAAIAHVRALQAKGVRNIDVGCMQVNLHHHRRAFESLEEAFDPEANVMYAASFLKTLQGDLKSWSRAVAHYHSATPELHTRYKEKVDKLWQGERRRDAIERTESVMAAYRERQAKRESDQAQRAMNRANILSQLATSR
ncbi:MAG: lytic transglycosylase domain-containing protein [Alphaproteobacteria bacterium]|nr:lytic transglycosylase domain-containing protein [Alphaproteobacteria bacterium]